MKERTVLKIVPKDYCPLTSLNFPLTSLKFPKHSYIKQGLRPLI